MTAHVRAPVTCWAWDNLVHWARRNTTQHTLCRADCPRRTWVSLHFYSLRKNSAGLGLERCGFKYIISYSSDLLRTAVFSPRSAAVYLVYSTPSWPASKFGVKLHAFAALRSQRCVVELVVSDQARAVCYSHRPLDVSQPAQTKRRKKPSCCGRAPGTVSRVFCVSMMRLQTPILGTDAVKAAGVVRVLAPRTW